MERQVSIIASAVSLFAFLLTMFAVRGMIENRMGVKTRTEILSNSGALSFSIRHVVMSISPPFPRNPVNLTIETSAGSVSATNWDFDSFLKKRSFGVAFERHNVTDHINVIAIDTVDDKFCSAAISIPFLFDIKSIDKWINYGGDELCSFDIHAHWVPYYEPREIMYV